MTKKVRHWRGRARTSASIIKSVNKDSFASAICPTNLEDQKQKFLEYGKTPEFHHRGTEEELEEIYSKPRSEIRFELLGEAMHILRTVKEKYGDAENYYTEMYGERITKEEATDLIVDYLKENHLDGHMSIIWCSDLPCSGRMMWQGPHVKYRRPEARKYSMWIKDSKDNNFLRLQGIRCLADHEIGTHFFRSYNDGLQPWFADRTRFGIRGMSGLEQLRTEEGLAAINTVLNANVRYLWGPALLYYIACKATEMTFKQLFEHLTLYVANPEWRWRHCVRVKRGLLNPNDIGGYGKDQCYFEGAVEILRNIDSIDFRVLMCGKICYDEVSRVKKLARLDCIQMPAFMRNQEKYKKTLKQIAHMNGLHLEHTKFKAPVAYLRRLKKGRRIGVAGGSKKVRKRGKKGSLGVVKGVGAQGKGGSDSTFRHFGSDDDDDDSDMNTEEGFYFQQYSTTAGSEDFYETMKKTMEKNNNNASINDGCEKFNYSYFQGLVDKFESVNREPPPQSKPEVDSKPADLDSLFTVPSAASAKRELKDWENDCVKSSYRCVSRASVQLVLSLPSSSLNSRRKTSNTESLSSNIAKSFLQRPLSSILPGRGANMASTCADMTTESREETRLPKVLSASTPSVNQVSQFGVQSTTFSSCSQEHSSQTNNQACTSPNLNQAQNTSTSLKKGTGGFIYPDADLVTDDMIVSSAGQSCNVSREENNSVGFNRLLSRRVKSANVLPPFTVE